MANKYNQSVVELCRFCRVVERTTDFPCDPLLNSAPPAWICGDLHLENFGAYKGDNRLSYFDQNDFGEAVLAPASWELSRFLVSVLVAVDTLKVRPAEAIALSHCFLDAYAANLTEGKARWVERLTADGMVRELLRDLRMRERPAFLDRRTDILRVSVGCAWTALRRCRSTRRNARR